MERSLQEIIDSIDPNILQYDQWLSVGMAIKNEGGTCNMWDEWSRRDPNRYREGECFRKWNGFHGSASPVTAGSLVALAKQQGAWLPTSTRSYGWSDIVSFNEPRKIVEYVQEEAVPEPESDGWRPVDELSQFIDALFDGGDHVGYVLEGQPKQGDETKWVPTRGIYSRTASELLGLLHETQDISKAMGDYDERVGAWIRVNPLDGNGINDSNVTNFKYTLIESDTESIERQAAIYKKLELPIATLVHSGGKSLHAIVQVDANGREEYRRRVNFLHEVCANNGLEIDTQNKNPSRLTRMPGFIRNGHKQYLVGLRQGKRNYDEWQEWIANETDDLPQVENLAEQFKNMPDLAPELIGGLLREGHKLLLAGPSKAGKSFLLLELAIAIAEGKKWLDWQCQQGRVLYVNLELDHRSCVHRLKNLYEAMGIDKTNAHNLDLWPLRGKSKPMDVLAPRLIRRAQKNGYKAVIIDPIYKVITGDENAADKMAHFCNQFDRVAQEIGASVIYCHHHSKGSQGQKNSRDRSSGSGVFARDPDAIIDLIELQLTNDMKKQIENRFACATISEWLNKRYDGWEEVISQDDAIVAAKLEEEARQHVVLDKDKTTFNTLCEEAKLTASRITGWRIESTLREFPEFEPKRIFFKYPIHLCTGTEILQDAIAEGEEMSSSFKHTKAEASKERKRSNTERLIEAFNVQSFNGEYPKIGDLASVMGVSDATLKRWIKSTKQLVVTPDGTVCPPEEAERIKIAEAYDCAKDVHGNVNITSLADILKCSERHLRRKLKEVFPESTTDNGYVKL